VTFHETFWAVAAGTAPVVALAAVVSISDLSAQETNIIRSIVDRSEKALRNDDVENDGTGRVIKPLFSNFGLLGILLSTQVLNVCLQTVILAVALTSLADQASLIAPWIVTAGLTMGLAILALVAFFAIMAKFRITMLPYSLRPVSEKAMYAYLSKILSSKENANHGNEPDDHPSIDSPKASGTSDVSTDV
jgi:hypothetical protein